MNTDNKYLGKEVYTLLEPLVKKKGMINSVQEFHNIINVLFHDIEAKYYDVLHESMWQSLPVVVKIFMDVILKNELLQLDGIKMLDIGCGTGLCTDLVLKTVLGSYIKHVDLLDTSFEMLKQCEKRAAKWSVSKRFIHGSVANLADEQYDMIMLSSVLHHIPDLSCFLTKIDDHLKRGGLIFHLQDLNGDYLNDGNLVKRCELLNEYLGRKHVKIKSPMKIIRRVWRGFRGRQPGNYIDELNRKLIDQKVIHSPLTIHEVYSITDIHNEKLPYATNQGVSLKKLSCLLNSYKMRHSCSYAYFGKLASDLPRPFKQQDYSLFQLCAPNGKLISALWQKQ